MTVLILHGTWLLGDGTVDAPGGSLFTWAERVPAGRRGRRPAGGPKAGAPHPFQARPEEVRDAVVAISPSLARQVERSTWRLVREPMRLPSIGWSPLPSPEAARALAVVGERPSDSTSETPLTLAVWQVRGVALDPVRAAQFLASLPVDGRLPGSSVLLGSDVRFWSGVAKLALELLARERFVPAIEHSATGFEARWRPVLDDARDAQRLEVLTRSLPPVARATEAGGGTPSARSLIQDFLDATVDALARAWLSGENGRRLGSPIGQNADQAWVEALRRGESAVRASSLDLERLAKRLAEWRAPLITPASVSSYRTCFRLDEPAVVGRRTSKGGTAPDVRRPTSAAWTLRIFLQATDDPSLLVPAEQVWGEGGSTLVYLNRRFEQPQERMLADLGRAARAFPPLDHCLAEPRPTSCRLSTEEAYAFLREGAWLLEELGFGVLVPNWWDRRGPRGRLGLRLRLRPAGDANGAGGSASGLLGAGALVEYDWRLAVGAASASSGQALELSEAEFRELAALKVPLVQIRGQWVELRPDKIEQAITLWEKRAHSAAMSTAEALSLALGREDVEGLPILEVEAQGWLGTLVERENGHARVMAMPPPPDFVGTLRPYQERGVGWLTFISGFGLGACLADDMGLGKTIEYIAFLLHRLAQGPPRTPSLLICPTSVVGNWRRELERFAPRLKVLVHQGPGRLAGHAFVEEAARHDLVITSYALVHRDSSALATVRWDGVVLDEAQNVKNPATLQARAVRAMPAGYRLALTGTPVENRLSDLWSIVDFLNPGYLGSQNSFRQRFITPIERWQDPERTEQLKRLVQPLVLRRVKTDPSVIQDLPEKLEMKVFCTLTSEQATLYQAVVTEMLARIEASDGMQRRGLVLATLTRLKQVCNHPAHFLGDRSALAGRSGKLARLEEMLEEALAAGDRALIFTQFRAFGDRLRDHLQASLGQEVLFLHGGVPAEQRNGLVSRFQADDGPPLFVLSLRAGGVGLNLTNANHVFHYDRWWNPAVEDQATDRAFRIGQRRNVQVHKFVCAGTLEEKIDALIESKKVLAQQVIGAGESWLTELSTAELRDLLVLRKEAVVE